MYIEPSSPDGALWLAGSLRLISRLSVEELHDLAESADPWVRESIRKHGHAISERLRLLERLGAFSQRAVLKGEGWRDWDGTAVGQDPEQVLREPIPLDPALPFEEFELFAQRSAYARSLVAAHPNTPPQALTKLLRDTARSVRIAAAKHPALPLAALEAELAKDDDPDLREALSRRRAAGP